MGNPKRLTAEFLYLQCNSSLFNYDEKKAFESALLTFKKVPDSRGPVSSGGASISWQTSAVDNGSRERARSTESPDGHIR